MMPITKMEIDDSDNSEGRLPPPVVNQRPLLKLTAAQKKKLLKQAGMQTLNLAQLESVSEIGDFVARLGLYKIEAAKLVASQSDIELIYAQSVRVAKKCKDDMDKQIHLLEIQDSLMGKRLKAIEIGLKAGEGLSPQDGKGTGGNAPIPFPPNVAVQINLDRVEQPHSDLK